MLALQEGVCEKSSSIKAIAKFADPDPLLNRIDFLAGFAILKHNFIVLRSRANAVVVTAA